MTRLEFWLVVALIAGGWFAWHSHELVKQGAAKEIAAELKQSAALKAASDKKLADAERVRHATEEQLSSYVASHPLDVSRLCTADGTKTVLPKAPARANPPADVLQRVPETDNRLTDDRSLLLEALAGLADSTLAAERERQ